MRKLLLLPLCCSFLFLLACGIAPARAGAEDSLPSNMNHSLRQLVAWSQAQPAGLSATERRARLKAQISDQDSFQADAAVSRVVVDVMLDGTVPMATVSSNLADLGSQVFARHEAPGPGSILSVRLPLDQAVKAANLPGVQSILLIRKPRTRVGEVTSEGVAALKVNQIPPPALDGTGITVGVISDSFNTATTDFAGNPLEIHEAQDIATGDLPGPGNPYGASQQQPVVVLQDGASTDTDEGRAMLQIVHDVAPGASLAFCTAGQTPEDFAQNVRSLRTDSRAHCSVIVDDIEFYEEPFFSDGVGAQAVDDVVHSTSIAGTRSLYYSAAGNDGSSGSYLADFSLVTDEAARAGLPGSNLKLDQVPAALTAGGFQNFDPRPGHTLITQQVKVSDSHALLDFQWDDPWEPGLITTDYNLLVFDADGNYLPNDSGTDLNPNVGTAKGTGQAIEFANLPLGPNHSDITYQLVICRTASGTQKATHLKYIVLTNGNFSAAKVTGVNIPTVFGHGVAPGADSIAAFNYQHLKEPTDYSSEGPATIYFDRDGNRLSAPDVREQPTLSAVDGVDTTFFPLEPGSDTDNNGFPNFSGTSAAAPHAAGVAALLLQAQGGPASLTDTQVRSLLESTAKKHDIDPGVITAKFASPGGAYSAVLTGNGNGSDNSAFSRSFFQLTFQGTPTSYLRRVSINLAPSGEEFDPTTASGFPFTIDKQDSTVAAADVKHTLGGPDARYPTVLNLVFAPGSFPSGGTLAFGIDRDDSSIHAAGNSADLLSGSTALFRVVDAGSNDKYTATFANAIGTSYSLIVGYGLIDAAAAVEKLRADGPPAP